MRFVYFADQKRALISRLLVRQACASALKKTNFDDIEIKRTKGDLAVIRCAALGGTDRLIF